MLKIAPVVESIPASTTTRIPAVAGITTAAAVMPMISRVSIRLAQFIPQIPSSSIVGPRTIRVPRIRKPIRKLRPLPRIDAESRARQRPRIDMLRRRWLLRRVGAMGAREHGTDQECAERADRQQQHHKQATRQEADLDGGDDGTRHRRNVPVRMPVALPCRALDDTINSSANAGR